MNTKESSVKMTLPCNVDSDSAADGGRCDWRKVIIWGTNRPEAFRTVCVTVWKSNRTATWRTNAASLAALSCSIRTWRCWVGIALSFFLSTLRKTTSQAERATSVSKRNSSTFAPWVALWRLCSGTRTFWGNPLIIFWRAWKANKWTIPSRMNYDYININILQATDLSSHWQR